MFNKVGLFVFVIIVVILICNKLLSTNENVFFPENLEIVNKGSSTQGIDLESKYKVLVFHNFDELSLHPFSKGFRWHETIKKYPEVSFIFYFSGKDHLKLAENLDKYDFPVPVFYDPNFIFYEKNNLGSENFKNKNLLSYIVHNDKVLDIAQIGFYDYFHRQLDELINE